MENPMFRSWRICRAWSGRLGFGAIRLRKQLLCTSCLVACLFIIYVQYVPSTLKAAEDLQRHRSLNSYRQREEGRREANVGIQKVRFLDSYVNGNVIPESREKSLKDESPLYRKDILQSGPSVPEKVQEVKYINQQFGDDKFYHDPIFEKKKGQGQGQGSFSVNMPIGSYFNEGSLPWTGGSVRYNTFGEPVYDHGNRPNYIPKEKVVHIDLKGAPPLPSAFKALIPWLAKYGASSVLLEYEDMFPWDGPLTSLAAGNHYTKSEIKEIVEAFKNNNIEVIPLVQTFGHLEFALKGKTFEYLREVPEIPQALCPSNNESMLLVRAMINQVMALHPNAKYLHIGCDEVFQMGECEKCRLRIRENLFLEHVSSVAKFVRSAFDVMPIIWHDMLIHISSQAMREYGFGELVEPMVWVYAEDIYRFVHPTFWSRLGEVFPNAWVASAFKGAYGEQSIVPNVRRHLDNNLNWLDVMAFESAKFSGGFRGLVLTGWQRFDHFAVLCELFPAAIPSLAAALITASHGYFNETLLDKLYTSLSCVKNQDYENKFDLDADPFLWNKFSWCFFPGALVFKLTARVEASKKEIQSYVDRVTLQRGWLADYNRRHNFSSPMRIDEDVLELPSKIDLLNILIRSSKEALSEWYDVWTIGEWIEQHIWPLMLSLEKLRIDSERMKGVKIWPKRPLALLPELEEYGIKAPTSFQVNRNYVNNSQYRYSKRVNRENKNP